MVQGCRQSSSVNCSVSCFPPEGRVMTPRRCHEGPSCSNELVPDCTLFVLLATDLVLEAANCTLLLSSQASGTKCFRADGILEWVSLCAAKGWRCTERNGEQQFIMKENVEGLCLSFHLLLTWMELHCLLQYLLRLPFMPRLTPPALSPSLPPTVLVFRHLFTFLFYTLLSLRLRAPPCERYKIRFEQRELFWIVWSGEIPEVIWIFQLLLCPKVNTGNTF